MITYEDIEVGDTVRVRTAWGTGNTVEGVVKSKERLGKNDQDVVDYHVDGEKFENWCYLYQIDALIKEK